MSDLGRWEPAPAAEVVARLAGFGGPWWIAGGLAIELAVGRPLRTHGDIDVLVLHRDHGLLHDMLPGWQLHAADPPGTLRDWPRGERLGADVHDIWCRPGPGEPWRIQFMLDGSDGAHWVSRRDPAVRMPIGRIGRHRDGIPYLAPEIQLFYKARARRPKDELDLAAALPTLDSSARDWLRAALPANHPWLPLLI